MEPEGSSPHSQVPVTCPSPSQLDSVHTATYHFLHIHLNIILPSMPGSPQWYLSLRFPHQHPVYASPLHHTRYMPRPSHPSRFYHPNINGWAVQIIKLLITYFSSFPRHLVPLKSKYSPQHPILKQHQPRFFPNVSDQVSHPYKTKGKITVHTIVS